MKHENLSLDLYNLSFMKFTISYLLAVHVSE